MNESDCKLITEKLLGECWHEPVSGSDVYLPMNQMYCRVCSKCKERYTENDFRTFTIPQDFMDCFDRLVEKGELVRFIAFAGSKCDAVIFIKWLLSRTESGHYRLCVLCAEWLNENK
jgi:hypothetical protein